jgi:citrate synthase
VAERATFTEVCYLLIYGDLPSAAELAEFDRKLTYHSLLHEDMKNFFAGFPATAHPMAMLSAMVASLSATTRGRRRRGRADQHRAPAVEGAHHRGVLLQEVDRPAVRVPAQRPLLHRELPAHDVRGAGRAVPHLAGGQSARLNLLLILHADHEQNCSTSTVRMVGSSQANLFACISAGICALWGRCTAAPTRR